MDQFSRIQIDWWRRFDRRNPEMISSLVWEEREKTNNIVKSFTFRKMIWMPSFCWLRWWNLKFSICVGFQRLLHLDQVTTLLFHILLPFPHDFHGYFFNKFIESNSKSVITRILNAISHFNSRNTLLHSSTYYLVLYVFDFYEFNTNLLWRIKNFLDSQKLGIYLNFCYH